jgi:hypothetical protein
MLKLQLRGHLETLNEYKYSGGKKKNKWTKQNKAAEIN